MLVTPRLGWRTVIVAVGLAWAATANAATPVGGSIISDTTWTLAGSPYNVTSNVVVTSGVTLTIEAGVTVSLGDAKAITVSGTLIARGTAVAPITFTASGTAWAYLRFNDGAADGVFDLSSNYISGSALEYCIIEKGGSQTALADNAAVELNKCLPFLANDTFRNNLDTALFASQTSGELKLKSCIFTRNNAADSPAAISVKNENIPDVMDKTLSDCTFTNNTGQRIVYLGATNTASNDNISDCTFDANTSTSTYEALYSYYQNILTMTNCTITGNQSGTSLLYGGNYATLQQCSFIENQVTDSDPNVVTLGYNAEIVDSTFTGNTGLVHINAGKGLKRNIFLRNAGRIYFDTNGSTFDAISGNLFVDNDSTNSQGGLVINLASTTILVNRNLFIHQTGLSGGGIYAAFCCGGDFVTTVKLVAQNNIFAFDGATTGAGAYVNNVNAEFLDNAFIRCTGKTSSAIEYSCGPYSWGNTSKVVSMSRNLFQANHASDLTSGATVAMTSTLQSTFSGTHDYYLNDSNLLSDASLYAFRYTVTAFFPEFDASNNYWGTTSGSAIDAKIYDFLDDANSQSVGFTPILTSASTRPPVSPVQGVGVTPGAPGTFTVHWTANPESDVSGYRVYVWNGAQAEPYFYVLDAAAQVQDAGNATSKLISGLGNGVHYFSVTAYDAGYTPGDEDPATPVIENMVGGHESFFSDPVPATGEPNQAPVLTAIGNKSVLYNNLLEFTVSATDGNAGDVLTLAVQDLPTGATFDPVSGLFSWTPGLADAGQYTVTFSVTDLFGPATDSEVITLTVLGPDTTAPEISIPGQNPLTVPCGGVFTPPLVTASDDRDGDLTASIQQSGSTVVPTAPNVYIIDYNVSDAAGNPAQTASLVVNVVDSVAPSVTLLGANPLTIPLFGNFSDPFASAYDTCVGDVSGTIQVSGIGNINTSVPASYPVTYTATDGVNTGQAVRNVNVVNSLPVLGAIGSKTVTAGGVLSFTVTASDANVPNGDTLTLSANPLPGNASFSAIGANTSEFSWTPQGADVGSYHVTFTATDSVAGTDSEEVVITVEPDTSNALFGTVREVGSGSPLEGVSVNLQEQGGPYTASDTTDQNGNYLLDGPAGGGAVDLNFTKANYESRNVPGVHAPRQIDVNLTSIIPLAPRNLQGSAGVGGNSLHWDANTETDLSGYNIYVSEEQGAFSKINGAPVTDTDYVHGGLTSGNRYDYKVTALDQDSNESPPSNVVTVEAGKIVMFIPNVSGPAGSEVRIPLNVVNAAGINPKGMDIDFRYPAPYLLNSDTGAVRVERTAITKQVAFLDNHTEAGRVRISFIGDADTLVGEGHLFNVYLTLANNVDGQCSLLEYADVNFFDASVPPKALPVDFSTAGNLCGDVACVQGDLNGDFEVNSADVLIALQISVGLLTPTACQLQASDLNGDRAINSADAIMIQRLAVGFPLNPPQPAKKASDAPALIKGGTLTVSTGSVSGAPGSLVAVPILLNDATALTGANLTIGFPGDPSQLTLESVDLGTLTSSFTREQNEGPGFVRLALSRSSQLNSGSGSLVVLNFHISNVAQAGQEFPITLNEVRLNGQFGDNFAWTQSIVRTDGAVTVGDAVIEGTPDGGSQDGETQISAGQILQQFASLDTNGDNEVSLSEATGLGLDLAGFNALDTNGDGRIEVHELLQILGPDAPVHHGDINADGSLSLHELLRIIQLYNAGGYVCQSTTEDGYVPTDGSGGVDSSCLPHSADYDGGANGAISLGELLRQIQIFHFAGYSFCKNGSEDNFCVQ